MALFFRENPGYNENVRKKGFDRYRQLMSFYALRWIKVNLLTVTGAIPLAVGIWFSVVTSSILVLIPASIIGGMIFGPFLAGMYDSIMRGLRDAPGRWWDHYKRSWKSNWKQSLLPGAVLGFLTGMFVFMLYIIWVSELFPGWGTVLLYLFSAILLILITTLYWPQLVLFQQSIVQRLINAILFTVKHFWKVLGVVLLQLAYIMLLALFMPWTLILIPFLGFWFIIFVAQFRIYDEMNEDFEIEAQYYAIEGDPWRVSPLDVPQGKDEEE